MPGSYGDFEVIEFGISGSLSTGVQAKRRIMPFSYEIIGVAASVNTAPTTTNLIFDIIAGPNGTANASLNSIWPVNNGTGIQVATMGGAPTGGTFTLTYNAVASGTIAYNATAATVQAALNATSTAPVGGVTVTGAAGGPWTINFPVGLATKGMLTAQNGSLTGGTSPAVTLAAAGPDNRPTILATKLDMAARANTVVSSSSVGIPSVPLSTTTEAFYPYCALPDPTSSVTYEGNQPVYTSAQNPVTVNTTEAGSSNQPAEAPNQGYVGNAGDALNVYVRQVGSGTAGSDATLMVLIAKD